MSIKNPFGLLSKGLDWLFEGSFPVALSKWGGVFALGTLSLCYIADKNKEDYQQKFQNLDDRITVIFQSLGGCIRNGHSVSDCASSQSKALDISKSIGTTLYYSSEKDCIEKHGVCKELTTGGGYTSPTSTYHPPVVAWQVANDDLSMSVPLYSTSEGEQVVRKDGKRFDLN